MQAPLPLIPTSAVLSCGCCQHISVTILLGLGTEDQPQGDGRASQGSPGPCRTGQEVSPHLQDHDKRCASSSSSSQLEGSAGQPRPPLTWSTVESRSSRSGLNSQDGLCRRFSARRGDLKQLRLGREVLGITPRIQGVVLLSLSLGLLGAGHRLCRGEQRSQGQHVASRHVEPGWLGSRQQDGSRLICLH